jgi:hypothetical protein
VCVALYKPELNFIEPVRSVQHVAPEWLDPYIVGHYQLGIANNVFNGVGMPDHVILAL